MKLQYILGGAGAGKTGYILDDIARSAQYEKIIYIVPEQFSLQSEKNLIARIDGGAALKAQVLSFRRLAYHVFSETGGGDYFDDIGKAMLLRRLLYEHRGELRFFARAADKQGFMEQLAAMVGEFYQYGVTAEKLGAWAVRAGRDDLRDKLGDLALIYSAYTEYVESRYIPTDAMLDALAGRMGGSGLVRGAAVWLSGFHGFTPQEYKVMEGLIQNAERVTVALTVKRNAGGFKLSPSDPFFETKRTVNRLTAIAARCGAKVEEPVFLGGGKAAAPELAFLEREFLARDPAGYPSEPPAISLLRADDRYAEIHQAAAGITELVRGGACGYGDIAVLTGDIDAYGRDIRDIFAAYGIPVFIDVKTKLPAHPLVEMILAMLDIPTSRWSYESVFRFLKTGMTQLTRDEADILENYVLAYGIKGGGWARERWPHGFDGGAYDEGEIHRLKNYCTETLAPLKGRGKRTAREHSAAVFALLERLKVTDTLDRQTEELERLGNQEQALRNRQIWGKVCGVFDVLVEVLGDERVALSEFAKILEAGLGVADLGLIPTAQIQVLAGDIERSRLPAVKALFVLGANDGVLPSVKENRSLIDDAERKLLDPQAEELTPGGRRRAYEQQFLIYQALSTPTERIFISYAASGAGGRALRPSALVPRIKRMFPELKERPADFGEKITLAEPMFARMGAALRGFAMAGGGAAGCILRDVYGWFARSERYSQRLRVMREIVLESIGGERLSPQSAGRLYGNELALSVSQLEKFAQCPFAYFVGGGLGARERRVYEVLAPDLGNLYHGALELFTKKQDGRSWRLLDKDSIARGVDECVAELAPLLGSEVLMSSARYKYVQKQAARVLKRSVWALAEHIKSGAFEIYATELGFGDGQPMGGVPLALDGGRALRLRGRIDRVDTADIGGGRYVKVIDYKSGNNRFDINEVRFGTQLQLMLYMDALLRGGTGARPGGVFYFGLNDPMVDYDEKTLENLDGEILSRFRMSGLALADPDVIRALDAGAGRSSKIIPASIGAKGEAGGASVATLAEFDSLREATVEKIKQLGGRMASGDINILPYKKGAVTGCSYCEYGAVCRFQGERYNVVREG